MLLNHLDGFNAFLEAIVSRCRNGDDDRLPQCRRRLSALTQQFREGHQVVGSGKDGGLKRAYKLSQAAVQAEDEIMTLHEMPASKWVGTPLVPGKELLEEAFALGLDWMLSWYKENLLRAKERLHTKGRSLNPPKNTL